MRLTAALASVVAASVLLAQLTPIQALAAPTNAALRAHTAAALTIREPQAGTTTAVQTVISSASTATDVATQPEALAVAALANEQAIIPTPNGGHSYFKTGGTEELYYNPTISFADLPDEQWPCSYQFPAFILATDEDGKSSWADINPDFGETDAFGKQAFTMRLSNTGMRYPGGELTLTYFSKVANDIYCSQSADPTDPDDTSGLVAYKTTRLTVNWQKPEIKDVYYKKNDDDQSEIHFEVDDMWGEFTTWWHIGGMAIFEIENYDDPQARKVSTAVMPCYETNEPDREGLTCKYNTAVPYAGTALGVASLPNNIDPATINTWPPAGAIDYKEILSNRTTPIDPQMTQAGPTDSADCLKLCAGDPVDTHNGNFYEKITDLQVNGRIGLEVTRRYAVGLLGTTGAYGDGWAMNYDMRLEATSTGNGVTIVEPSGNLSRFVKNSASYTARAANLRADLNKTNTGWEFSRWDEDLSYVFDEAGVLVSIRDNNGHLVTVAHNAAGRVAAVTEGDRSLRFTWDGDLLTSVKDHTRRTVSYGYTDGKLTSVVDAGGNTSAYTYDNEGRVHTMTNPAGGVTNNVYDAEGRISEQTQPNGQVLEFSYGSYNTGLQKQINTVTSGDVTKTYVYDQYGRILSFEDTSDPTAEFERSYDSSSNIKTEELIDGSKKKFAHTYANGNRVKTTEANAGSAVSSEYDDQHRVTAHINASGVRTENFYDEGGNLEQVKVIPTDGGEPRITTYEVDANGDIAAVVNPLGGRSELNYDAAGQLTSVTDPNGAVTTNAYDTLGRLVQTVSPGGNAAGVRPAEKAKFTTSYGYDELNNPRAVSDQNGTTSYNYDALNRPWSVVDPPGNTKEVEYDAVGNPVRITYPDGSTDEFTYDLDTGLRASWTDPQGLTTQYSYDDGAVTTTLSDGSSSTIETEVGYRWVNTILTNDRFPNGHEIKWQDATNMSINPEGISATTNKMDYDKSGRLITESQNGKKVTYAYDGFGQLKSRTGQDRDVSYEYDLAGNIIKTTYADGSSVSHETDLAGRIVKTTSWDGTEYDFEYSPENQLVSMASDTGLGYDTAYNGARLTSKIWTDSAGAELKNFSYQYEASGLMHSDSVDSLKRQFEWNDNGALTWTGQDQVMWDARLLTKTDVRYLSYSSTTGRLAQSEDTASTTEYTYDAQGNRTKSVTGSDETNYTWNGLNQLTELDTTTYSYGADGIRTKVGSAAQVYDQGLKLLSDGEMKYLWSPDGSLLAQAPLNSTNNSESQQTVTDALGSVYTVLNHQLASMGEYSYSVFGERRLTAGTDVSAMGFTSEQHDASGLIYLRYRYLDPSVGQFISVDPLISSTLDPYGYASGNPLQMTDPLGLFSWGDVGSFLYNNAGTISTVLSVAAIAASATGVGAPVGAALGVASAGFALASAHKNFSEGNDVDGWVDVAAGTLGLGAFGAGLKSASAVTKSIRSGAQTRAQVNAARRTSERIRKNADDASYGLLAATTAGKGVLC